MDVTTGLKRSQEQKQHGKTLQHWRALPLRNVTEFPSLLLTSTMALHHFSPLILIPGPPHEGTLLAENVSSQVTLPSLVFLCPHCLVQQLLPGLQAMIITPI